MTIRHPLLAVAAAAAAGCASTGAPPLTDRELAFTETVFVQQPTQHPHRSIDDIRQRLAAWQPDERNCAVEKETMRTALASPEPTRGKDLPKWREMWHLVHLAQTEIVRGNHTKAIAALENARRRVPYREYRTGHAQALSAIARAYARAGDVERARSVAAAANTFWRLSENDNADKLREFFGNLSEASIAQAEGSLRLSEIYYRRVFGDLFAMWSGADLNFLRAELAANLVLQGRLTEAEIEARRAVMDGQYTAQAIAIAANSVGQLAQILLEQGRIEDAEYLARKALAMQEHDCPDHDSISLANARAALARTLAIQGNWRGVREQYAQIAWGLTDERATLERLYATDVEWALALVETGSGAQALAQIQRALEATGDRFGADSIQATEMMAFRGVIRSKTGDVSGALADLRAALPGLVDRNTAGIGKGRRIGTYHFRLIVEAYLDALSHGPGAIEHLELDTDDLAHPFRVADALRGRRVQAAMTYSSVRSAVRDRDLAVLVRQKQDAELQLASQLVLLTRNQALPPNDVDLSLVARLHQSVEAQSQRLDDLSLEIARRFPAYADLTNPQPGTLSAVRRLLQRDEALLAIYVGAERSYVWAVPGTGRIAAAVVPVGREQLAEAVARLRLALDPGVSRISEIPAFDAASAHRLFAAFLAPVEAGWKHARHLLVVADGALAQLPFSLLPSAPPRLGQNRSLMFDRYRNIAWLARTHSITSLPSVTSLITLRSAERHAELRRRFLGFGDPQFAPEGSPPRRASHATAVVRGFPVQLRSSPQTRTFRSADLTSLPRLPDTAEEVRAIAAALGADPSRDVLLGTDASETNVKSIELAQYRVVAFATHGLLPGDLDGLLEPALALSNPQVAGGADDGLLTMGEILGLRLSADWVVLSACNTAAGDGAGAEAVSGLGRAFFYAGTRALLVSHWPVETTSAKAITTELFRLQADDPRLSRSSALQQTVLSLIDGPGFIDPSTGNALFSYAHPIFWAPFALIGDRV